MYRDGAGPTIHWFITIQDRRQLSLAVVWAQVANAGWGDSDSVVDRFKIMLRSSKMGLLVFNERSSAASDTVACTLAIYTRVLWRWL